MAKKRNFTSLTQQDIAAAHGVDVRTVRRWDADGHPRNADGTYTAADSIRWRIQFEMNGLDATAARAWRDREAATSLALRNERERGHLIYVDQVTQCLSEFAATMVSTLSAMPSRIASTGALKEAAELRQIAMDEVNAARESLATYAAGIAEQMAGAK